MLEYIRLFEEPIALVGHDGFCEGQWDKPLTKKKERCSRDLSTRHLMYKAYKFRLYPNKEQIVLINKTFGCYRFIYNYFLDKFKNNGYIKAYDMCLELKEMYNKYEC